MNIPLWAAGRAGAAADKPPFRVSGLFCQPWQNKADIGQQG